MEKLNNYVPLEDLMRTLCVHNKRHLQEITRLQEEIEELNKQIRQYKIEKVDRQEELAKLKRRMGKLDEVEPYYDRLKKRGDPMEEKAIKRELRKEECMKNMRAQIKMMNQYYAKIKKEHDHLMQKLIKLEIEYKGYSMYM